MNSDLVKLKAAMRATVRAKLAALSPGARAEAAALLCSRLRKSDPWSKAKSVLLFSPLMDEPDIWPLAVEGLAAEKQLGLPRFSPADSRYVAAQVRDLERDLHIGKFQIREPRESCREMAPTQFDLILVPGVAFDRSGRRLGRGRGFYDRLLKGLGEVTLCGVAFEEQWLEGIPTEGHDVVMDYMATPMSLLRCRAERV